MLIEKRFLPWGTQRAGCCTKLNANKRSHEKEDIVYCTVVENDGSDRILWEEIFYDLRNWGKELSYMASTTASTFRAKKDLLCSLPGTGNAIRSGACSTDASRYRESWDCVKRGVTALLRPWRYRSYISKASRPWKVRPSSFGPLT